MRFREMVMFWARGTSRAVGRNERLFSAAIQRFETEVKTIFARHAADGLLKSGKTIKVVVRAMEAATLTAIDEALMGIASVTEHAGRERKNLLETLLASLALHQAEIAIRAQQALTRIGLGGDFKHALPLIEEAKVRQAQKILDFSEGWTAPAGKPWKDRHPILFAIVIALIGAAAGWLGKSLMGEGAQRIPAPGAIVSPINNQIGKIS